VSENTLLGEQPQTSTNEEALLEHIIEETCESVDSLLGGLDGIVETMKSNFNPPS
jgi:hypothetical protein